MNFLLKKIHSKIKNLTEKQIEDLNRLYEDHKSKKTYIHNSIPLLLKQIEVGIEDLYDRHYLIKKELKPKDSSSLHSFIIKFGENHGKRLYDEKNKKTAQTLEKYIEKYGEDAGPSMYKEYCISKGASLEGFILRHGGEEGPKKHKEYWENTNFTINEKKLVEHFGEDVGKKKYEKIKKKIGYANTLECYQKRYGNEDGKTQYEASNTKRSESQSKETMIEKMLASGRSMDDILISINDRWSRSLETYQKKFGVEKGKEKYDKMISNMKMNNPICIEYYEERGIPEDVAFDIISTIQAERNSKNNFFSKESMRVLLPVIYEIEKITGVKCMYGDNEHKIYLRKEEHEVSNKRLFFYDFTFPELGIIIEYHGEVYHEDIDYNATLNMDFLYFKMEFKIDHFKKWVAENRGYYLHVVRSWCKQEDMNNLRIFLHERGIDICKTKFI